MLANIIYGALRDECELRRKLENKKGGKKENLRKKESWVFYRNQDSNLD